MSLQRVRVRYLGHLSRVFAVDGSVGELEGNVTRVARWDNENMADVDPVGIGGRYLSTRLYARVPASAARTDISSLSSSVLPIYILFTPLSYLLPFLLN